jgi:hypothetical protein
MAEPQWRREAKDVAVTVVVDSSDSIPTSRQQELEAFIAESVRAQEEREDHRGTTRTQTTRSISDTFLPCARSTAALASGVWFASSVATTTGSFQSFTCAGSFSTLLAMLFAAFAPCPQPVSE